MGGQSIMSTNEIHVEVADTDIKFATNGLLKLGKIVFLLERTYIWKTKLVHQIKKPDW